ncbi:MAG: amidohydrolase [Clostridia bacterium]|nr:amidohydrolase [Clostridia bacterium]
MEFKEALTLKAELTKHRRHLHENPEIGFSLDETKAYVLNVLKEYGYAPTPCGKCGITATVGKGEKCILLRADMDALPISEQTNLPYKSKKENQMHACGHDMHTAMLLGAAKLLKANEDVLKGTVKLMFQPAEEILSGAKDMIKNGVLENPKPDCALMIHVSTGLPQKAGTIIISAPGTVAPSADHFEITVTGKGCHGSTPQNGTDPILAGAHILSAVSALQTREFSGTPITLTFGSFRAGNCANAIPETATLSGTLRMFDEPERVQFKARLTTMVQDLAKSFGTTASVNFFAGCPSLICDEKLATLGLKIFPNSINAGSFPKKASGSEDFAYISHQTPSLLINIAAGDSRNGFSHPLHNAKTTFDESALPVGSFVYAKFAESYLRE